MMQPSIRTIQRYKQIIRSHFQIVEFNSEIESKLQQHAIELAENFNLPKSENARQPQCPKEKEEAIVEALKAFQMI